jgi:hypothetical protein
MYYSRITGDEADKVKTKTFEEYFNWLAAAVALSKTLTKTQKK